MVFAYVKTRCRSGCGQKENVALDRCPMTGNLSLLSTEVRGIMRHQAMMRCGRAFAIAATLTTTVLAAPNAEAAVTVLAPGATVAGKTIGAWSADWWIWAFSQSVPNDAITDTSGANAAINQSGPVFFVAGGFGGSYQAQRAFNVPANAYVLVPLFNNEWSDLEEKTFVPSNQQRPVPLSEAQLLDTNNGVISNVTSLHAVIDGVPVLEQDLFLHLETSPIFQFTAAANNPFGVPQDDSGNALAKGYYLMLGPLGLGTHAISYGGKYDDGSFIFETDANATITGVPEPTSLAMFATSLMGLAWARRRRA